MTIDELRQRIDQLDERLVELLSERAHCALEIGKLKQALGLEVYQPDREKQVLHHVQTHGKHTGSPLEGDAIVRVFERIIDEARRIERATAHNSPGLRGNASAGQAGKGEDS
jgi:chorismate mutase